MWKSFFALLAICSIANCVPTKQVDLPRAVSDFASDLYWQVAKTKPGNVVISPLSVATSLALLSQGAEGSTFTELQHGLHLNDMDKSTIANQYHRFTEILRRDVGRAQLNLANQIYVQQGHRLNKNFQDVASNKFRSGVQTLNFGEATKSAELINRFVEQKTNGKIRHLVDSSSLSADTDVYMVNAIYFKGQWEHAFDKKWTRKAPFYTKSKQQIQTEFMKLENRLNYIESEELQATLVELKYADSKLAFIVALPYKSSNLEQVAQKIKQHKLFNIIRQMKPQAMTLLLPKFKVEYEIELKDVLKQLHMGTIMTDKANLRGLLEGSDTKNVIVSNVVHKAVIEIDEQGSEASGSTGVGVAPNAIHQPMNVNSPFLYYIRDTEANTIIFNGRIETVDWK